MESGSTAEELPLDAKTLKRIYIRRTSAEDLFRWCTIDLRVGRSRRPSSIRTTVDVVVEEVFILGKYFDRASVANVVNKQRTNQEAH